MNLSGREIVLGVTGGIAAYKSADLVSRLRRLGANISVIMTRNATEFVAPLTFQTLSANQVVVDTFHAPEYWNVEHVALAQKAEVFVVAPATANILAKMAHGLADDMLSTTMLATRAPILVAPAMNTGMWNAPATQENVRILQSRGVLLVGPDSGRLACGDTGAGRMSEPAEIVEAICRILCPDENDPASESCSKETGDTGNVCVSCSPDGDAPASGKETTGSADACDSCDEDFSGLNVLVTAGATRERLDPVRFLTNDSSGKMGFALAEAARDRGARVTVVVGSVSVPIPEGVRVLPVESTEDLLRVLMEESPAQDVIIQAAAPADYRPAECSPVKMKKHKGEDLLLRLVETPDVAKAVGEAKRPGQILVGFAAETDHLVDHALAKMEKKRLDLMVANDVTLPGAGFGTDTNIATLITKTSREDRPLQSKRSLAEEILDRVLSLRTGV